MLVCDRCGISNREAAKRHRKPYAINNVHLNTANIGTEISVDLCNGCRAELIGLIQEFIEKKEA